MAEQEFVELEIPLPEIKPGARTTEFWIVVLSYVLALATMFGLVTVDWADQFTAQVYDLLLAVGTVTAALGPVVSSVMYIWGRYKLKVEQQRGAVETFKASAAAASYAEGD